jgi:hypothetical protein
MRDGHGLVRRLVGAAVRPGESGFLGDYTELKHNPDYAAALVYINPGAQWSQYTSIQLDSVTLWGSEKTERPERRKIKQS